MIVYMLITFVAGIVVMGYVVDATSGPAPELRIPDDDDYETWSNFGE